MDDTNEQKQTNNSWKKADKNGQVKTGTIFPFPVNIVTLLFFFPHFSLSLLLARSPTDNYIIYVFASIWLVSKILLCLTFSRLWPVKNVSLFECRLCSVNAQCSWKKKKQHMDVCWVSQFLCLLQRLIKYWYLAQFMTRTTFALFYVFISISYNFCFFCAENTHFLPLRRSVGRSLALELYPIASEVNERDGNSENFLILLDAIL